LNLIIILNKNKNKNKNKNRNGNRNRNRNNNKVNIINDLQFSIIKFPCEIVPIDVTVSNVQLLNLI